MSVWIHFLSNRAPYAAELDGLLSRDEVTGHEFVYGELLMGDKGGRKQLLANYEQMHQAPAVPHREVVEFVRDRRLHGRGIAWIDAHPGVRVGRAAEIVDDGSAVDGNCKRAGSRLSLTSISNSCFRRLQLSEEERVEEHLLACDACGDHLRGIIQLSEALRELAQSGTLRVVVAEEFIKHALESGRHVRQYDFVPGQTVPCTISADDELLVARLAADVSGAERVDLSFCDAQGVERHGMDDIPVRTDAGRVIFQESAVFAKASPSTTMVARLLAVSGDGGERLLGEYTFQHTRTIPGPPGWER